MKNLRDSSFAIQNLDSWLAQSIIRLQDRYEDYCMETPNKNHEPWLAAFRMLRKAHAEYVLEVLEHDPDDQIYKAELARYAWATSHNIEDAAKAGKMPDKYCIVDIVMRHDADLIYGR